jgi:hypothetical protein
MSITKIQVFMATFLMLGNSLAYAVTESECKAKYEFNIEQFRNYNHSNEAEAIKKANLGYKLCLDYIARVQADTAIQQVQKNAWQQQLKEKAARDEVLRQERIDKEYKNARDSQEAKRVEDLRTKEIINAQQQKQKEANMGY